MRNIDVTKGYDKLSEKDKIYLATRGKLPREHVTDSIRQKLDLSGRASTVASGGNSGTIRNASTAELEAELEARKNELYDEDDNPVEFLMPDLANPHSEREDEINANHEETASTQHKRDAAAQKAKAGPAVPTLGHPANKNLTEFSVISDPDDEEGDDEEFEPTVEEGDDAYSEWKKKALVAEAEGRGLSSEGKAADLVARLKRDDADELEEGDEASDDEE